MKKTVHKYGPGQSIDLKDRMWPSNRLTAAPRWCSVDLRDGNQALASPMTIEKKLAFFRLLTAMGFKEIEAGFPAASRTEYDFIRFLIEHDLIPEDVTIQVITQAREHIIERTLDALRGARRAIVGLYVSTSPVQRNVVLRKGRHGTLRLAVHGAKHIRHIARELTGTEIGLKFCPESFTVTEPAYALEVSEAVMDEWDGHSAGKVILNLAASVEVATPNIFADRVEWFSRNMTRRQGAVISLHCHNDRGTAVAATELGLLAGAERVEGTLFGNGERAGIADVLTVALNLFSQGIDPGLDLEDLPRIVSVYERCTGMRVLERHPYAGELAYTTFAGSHQDAIVKGLRHGGLSGDGRWNVPYLPIDPADIGRQRDKIIRINGQSGRSGVKYVLEHDGVRP